MREGWEKKKLGDVFSFRNGVNFKKEDKNGKGVLTIDVLNMYNDGLEVGLDDLYRVDKDFKESYMLKKGDVLFVRSSLKKEGVAWPAYFGQHEEDVTYCGFIIRGRPKIELNPRYAVYYLRSAKVRRELISNSVESTITNVSQKTLKKIDIFLPPLAEQKRIVSILDEAFESIDQAKANIEQNIKNAKELFESKLNQVFSQYDKDWAEKKIKEVSATASNIKWKEANGERDYIDLSSVSRVSLKITDTDRVNRDNAPSRAKKIVREGDVIFGTTRPTLKRVAIIDKEYSNQICSTGYYVIRPNREIIISEWIFISYKPKSLWIGWKKSSQVQVIPL